MPGLSDSSAVVRRGLAALVAVVVLLLVALSPSFGRAEPTGAYRPDLPPEALSTGCYPLPDGLELDFPHQVRRDDDVPTDDGVRRRLLLQYDVVDEGTVAERLTAAFEAAGFTAVPAEPGALAFTREDTGRVTAEVEPIPDVADDAIVRGTVVLDLPSVPVASDDPVCDDPYTTKRFPSSYEPAA